MEATFNIQQQFFHEDQKSFKFSDENGSEHILSLKILNHILSLIAFRYINNGQDYFEYTEIHSSDFKKIASDYRYYIEWAEKNSILIVNDSYIRPDKALNKKGRSKKYAFNDEFKQWGCVVSIKRTKPDQLEPKPSEHLIKIKPDVSKKIKRDFFDIQINDTPIQKTYKIESGDLSIVDFKSYLRSEFNLWRMRNSGKYFTWKSGRLFTNFTSCSSATRKNNFFFESKLASLDIPSSFPLWLAVWLKNHGIDTTSHEYQEYCTLVQPEIKEDGSFKKNDEGKIKTGFYNDFREKLDNNRNLSLSKPKKNAKCRYQEQIETKPGQYKMVKCNLPLDTETDENDAIHTNGKCKVHGYILENLAPKPMFCRHVEIIYSDYDENGEPRKSEPKKCKRRLNDDGYCSEHGLIPENNQFPAILSEKRHISKAEAKEMFSMWLNGDSDKDTWLKYIVSKYYGDIQAIVDQHKKGNKSFMYFELAKLETDFIFNVVCSRLYQAIPKIQIITCHDEIYFEEKYKEQVEAIWVDALKSVYSTLPRISYDDNLPDEVAEIVD